MERYCVVLLLLSLLVTVSSGQEEWLGGGYVGHGGYSETNQYFMDPIFYFTGNYHYISPDPAVGQMQAALDYPINGHYLSGDPAIRQMQDYLDYGNGNYASGDPAVREMQNSLDWPRHLVDGHWQLWLTDGTSLDLTLSQSGNEVFGYGLMTSGRETQRVTASGSIYGRDLELGITPDSGIKSYVISIDVGYLPLSGTYTAYRAGTYLQSGMVKISRPIA